MKKILVFGGTTEGRQTAEMLAENQIECDVCVATEYGEELLEESRFINVKQGRLAEPAMKELLAKGGYAAVIDATHPFATAVSSNIMQCMAENNTDIPLFRFEREINRKEDDFCTYFDSAESCAESLKSTAGTIMLTTGSKDLHTFCQDHELRKRLVARVLPSEESIRLCHEAGLEGSQIIAMQGPFSQKMNEAQIEDFHVSVLVTKESGKTGGEDTKIAACRKQAVKCFIIKKPENQTAAAVPKNYAVINSLKALAAALEPVLLKKLQISCKLCITLAGIGMGSAESMTVQVQNALLKADYVFGAPRMIESVKTGGKKYAYYLAKDIVPLLRQIQAEKAGACNAVVLFSGDTGFFSGAESLCRGLEASGFGNISVLPGVSSLSCLASKFKISWQNVSIISMHGMAQDEWLPKLCNAVRNAETVFFITSGAQDVRSIAEQVMLLKKNDPKISDYIVQLGYQLSYKDEKTCSLNLEECLQVSEKGLYSGFLVPKREKEKQIE